MSSYAVVLVLALAGYDDRPDLARIQGTWEMTVQQGTTTYRIRKTIDGNKETVRQYQDEKLVREHVVEFELIETENVKIFRWKEGRVTAGTGAGRPMADGQYIYRLDGDQLFGVFGLLKGEQRPLSIEAYKRVKLDGA